MYTCCLFCAWGILYLQFTEYYWRLFALQFPQGEASPRTEESREMTFPFLIFTGSLERHDTIYLAADKHIICDFEASLVASALTLLATYYLFMYNYPPELKIFLLMQKCIFAYSKLPSSVISLLNFFHEYQSVSAKLCFMISLRQLVKWTQTPEYSLLSNTAKDYSL